MLVCRSRHLGVLVAALSVGGALSAPVASASAGGAGFPPTDGAQGGTEYGSALWPRGRPVASRFRVAPTRVIAGAALPRILVRFDEAGVPKVRARVVLQRASGHGRAVRVELGTVQTGRTLRPRWPRGTRLTPGRYVARVHATNPAGRTLLREQSTSGRSRFTVVAPPPPPTPSSPPPPAAVPPAPVAPAGAPGTFPVAGPHTYGDGIGADRGDHTHEGVDILGAEGLAIVAPTAGTVRFTDYEADGAGEYVVMRSVGGSDFFFAHCMRGSTQVAAGQAVREGQPLCSVGTTGSSTTPHLHFELWPSGWRTGAKESVFADPLPQLKAWEG